MRSFKWNYLYMWWDPFFTVINHRSYILLSRLYILIYVLYILSITMSCISPLAYVVCFTCTTMNLSLSLSYLILSSSSSSSASSSSSSPSYALIDSQWTKCMLWQKWYGTIAPWSSLIDMVPEHASCVKMNDHYLKPLLAKYCRPPNGNDVSHYRYSTWIRNMLE